MKRTWIGMFLVALGSLGSPRLMAQEVDDETLRNWPQWRGPTWNGVAPLADPPVTWSETSNLRWKTPIEGKAWSSPAIVTAT